MISAERKNQSEKYQRTLTHDRVTYNDQMSALLMLKRILKLNTRTGVRSSVSPVCRLLSDEDMVNERRNSAPQAWDSPSMLRQNACSLTPEDSPLPAVRLFARPVSDHDYSFGSFPRALRKRTTADPPSLAPRPNSMCEGLRRQNPNQVVLKMIEEAERDLAGGQSSDPDLRFSALAGSLTPSPAKKKVSLAQRRGARNLSLMIPGGVPGGEPPGAALRDSSVDATLDINPGGCRGVNGLGLALRGVKEKRLKERPRIYPKSAARHLRPTTLPGKAGGIAPEHPQGCVPGPDASTCDNIRSANDDCERASLWLFAASSIIDLLHWLDGLMISLGAFFFSLLVGLFKVPVRVVSAIISDKPPWIPGTPQTVRKSSYVGGCA